MIRVSEEIAADGRMDSVQDPSGPSATVPETTSRPTGPSASPEPPPTVFSRLRSKLDEHAVRERPLWQRIIYPFLGVAAIIGGLFAAVMPVVPGGLLIPVGLVFLMCFHPRGERWMKRLLCRLITWTERVWTRLFPPRQP